MAKSIKRKSIDSYSLAESGNATSALPKYRQGLHSQSSVVSSPKTVNSIIRNPGTAKEDEHHTRLGEHAAALWKYNKITDITIKLRGTSYPAHKTVLSCYSKYFKDMLLESKGNISVITLQLDSVTNEAFSVLLKYMYTADLHLTCQNIGEVYTASRKLGMDGALQICIKILTGKSRHEVHSVYVFVTAKKLGLGNAAERALHTMCKRFEQIVGTPEYLELMYDQVIEYLSADTLAVRSEVIVYLAALKWISVKFLEREQFATDVISCVRFPMMTLNEILACHSPPLLPGIIELPALKDLILKATCFVSAKSVNEEKRFQRYSCTPRTYLLSREPIILWDPNIFDPDRHAMYSEELAATTIQAAFRGYKTRMSLQKDDEAAIQRTYKRRHNKSVQDLQTTETESADDFSRHDSALKVDKAGHLVEDKKPSLTEKIRKSMSNFFKKPMPHSSESDNSWKESSSEIVIDKRKPSSEKSPKMDDEVHEKKPSWLTASSDEDQEDFLKSKRQNTAKKNKETRRVHNREVKMNLDGQSRLTKRYSDSSFPDSMMYNEPITKKNKRDPGSVVSIERAYEPMEETQKGLTSSMEALSEHVSRMVSDLKENRNHGKQTDTSELVKTDQKNRPDTVHLIHVNHQEEKKKTLDSELADEEENLNLKLDSSSDVNCDQREASVSEESCHRELFVAGGFNANDMDNENSGKEVFLYDPALDRWTPLTEMPRAIHHHRLVYLNGSVYSIGGCNPEKTKEGKMVPLRSCYKFDLNIKRWCRISKMRHARMYHSAAALNGKIYVVGGKDEENRMLDSVEVYDPSSDTWSQLKESLEQGLLGVGICSHNGRLWILGGMVQDHYGKMTITDDVKSYNPSKKEWSRFVRRLPYPRAFLTAVECRNRVHVIGGTTYSDDVDSYSDEMMSVSDVLCYDEQNKKWKEFTSLPNPRHYVGVATVEKSLFVVGGLTSYKKASLIDVMVYSDGKWHDCSSLPEPLCGFAVVSVPKVSENKPTDNKKK